MLLNDRTLELVAERFRVLSDPLRLRLLNALSAGEKSVAELVDATGASQANVSKHLGVLARAGLVSRRKAGLYVYYDCPDKSVFQVCDVVCGSLKSWLAAGLAQFDTGRARSGVRGVRRRRA